ncbi:hypothetical protein COLO4_08755 [Corchorus olitorius]|uniref:RRM domain-containing protein n=1 Tax=Corchorus olitorius TaxID=93759 RepID=A0A1R3KEQ2_9ROSI|nr:hypothetical protein COLO4_08755 [Corchorus olitorius]
MVRGSSSGVRRKGFAGRVDATSVVDDPRTRFGDRRHKCFDWKGRLKYVFVDNIGREVSRKQIWEFFGRFGRVVDVYFPPSQQRVNGATKYCFVRFRFEEERQSAISQGHRNFVWGFKIYVKFANSIYGSRNKVMEDNQVPGSGRLNQVFHVPDGSDVFEEKIGEEGSKEQRRPVEVKVGGACLNQKFVPFSLDVCIPKEEMKWIDRSAMGRLAGHGNLSLINEGLVCDWVQVDVRFYSSEKAILVFPDKELWDVYIHDYSEFFHLSFSEIIPLKVFCRMNDKVKVWVKLEDAPVQLWHVNFFSTLANSWVEFKIFAQLVSESSLPKYSPPLAAGTFLVSSESRDLLECEDEEGEESCSFVKDSCSPLNKDTCLERANDVGYKVDMQKVGSIKADKNINGGIDCYGGCRIHLEERCSCRERLESSGVQQIASIDDCLKVKKSVQQGIDVGPSLNGTSRPRGGGPNNDNWLNQGDLARVDSEGTISDPLGLAWQKAKSLGNGLAANSVGASGGLISMWDDNLFTLESSVIKDCFILVIGSFAESNFRCVCLNIYAPKSESNRREFFAEVIFALACLNLPILVGGDFNTIRCAEERVGLSHSAASLSDFNEVIEELELLDFPLVLESSWNDGLGLDEDLCDKLKRFKPVIKSWAFSKFGKGKQAISLLEEEIQRLEGFVQTGVEIDKYQGEIVKLKSELWQLYRIEERTWFQKSRLKWHSEGDRNTRYFHLVAKARQKYNQLLLLLVDGKRVDDPIEIKEAAADFFEKHFCQKRAVPPSDLDCSFKQISARDWMERPFSEKEVFDAIMSCDGSRAPGSDGYNMLFFQKHWASLKKDIMSVFNEFNRTGHFEKKYNVSFLTLIPKVSYPSQLHEFSVERDSLWRKVVLDKYYRDNRCLLPDRDRSHRGSAIWKGMALWLIMGTSRMNLGFGALNYAGTVLIGRESSLKL